MKRNSDGAFNRPLYRIEDHARKVMGDVYDCVWGPTRDMIWRRIWNTILNRVWKELRS